MDNPGEIFRLCRLCLVKDQVNIPIFEDPGDIRQIFLKISSCLPVKISRDDELPQKICDGCSNKLDLLYEFWNTSANAEKTLLSWLGQAGVKDADETISAVAQQIAKPAETQVKEETEALEDGNAAIQIHDSFEGNSYDEGTKDETESPPPKRARRTAAVKAQINITPESDDDDDMDSMEPMTKMEDESDESDGEDKDPSYTEVPGTSADDQPGPSGLGKDGVEAPAKIGKSIVDSSKHRPEKIQCFACRRKFSSKPQIERHLRNLAIKVLCKCIVCQRFYPPGNYCDHLEVSKTFHCEFCGVQIHQPHHFHSCFHMDRKIDSKKVKNRVRKQKHALIEELSDIKVDLEYTLPEPTDENDECTNESKSPVFFDDKEGHSDQLPDVCSDIDDTDMCIYCNTTMPTMLLSKHESWHRKFDKNVRLLTDTRSSRLQRNSEGLCAYCGLIKPGNKLRRHEYVEHVKKYVRKVCDICGIFTCPTYIKEHMRTHDAEKGFKCGDCGKAFFRKKALARHRLVHTDVAQYMCTVCGKSFKIKFNLRVHMRTHEDIKPFPCSVCKKTFTTKQWRDNHLKTHGIVGNR